ncbi:DUF4232 domain-containing protein [Streptomyces sudanensis]|uniref:DUF4232 domain-containing protein n=1 Tax=Streptomyces sudanensis TaxID=436397 RepID=UPI0020CE2D58|nr:DUF4232 domain-containing protein [Streptomyces sudanensis]MCP9988612.1 DUF4232 domain-containing protein [Streptomyces sudanensis]
MPGKHTRKAVVTAMGLAAVLSLTACNGEENIGAGTPTAPSASVGGATGSTTSGSGGGSSAGPDTSGSSAGSDTSGSGGSGSDSGGSSSGGSPSGRADGGGGSDSDGTTGICRTRGLRIDAVDNSTDDEAGVVTVSLRNSGSGPCRISGYAGVDLRTSDGDTLSADRNGDAAPSTVLAVGETAAFNIHYPKNNSGGTGVRPTTIVVTAPDDTTQATVPWPGGSLPVTGDPGDGGSLEISPVGKVG